MCKNWNDKQRNEQNRETQKNNLKMQTQLILYLNLKWWLKEKLALTNTQRLC